MAKKRYSFEEDSGSNLSGALGISEHTMIRVMAGEAEALRPRLRETIGERVLEISPLHHVRKGAPPTIIFHGTADTTVPFKQAEDFRAAMKKHGNRCELMPYEGRAHGFFNYGRGDGQDFLATLRATDEFLVSLGYLKGAPTLDRRIERPGRTPEPPEVPAAKGVTGPGSNPSAEALPARKKKEQP